jgi:hypothetical protein
MLLAALGAGLFWLMKKPATAGASSPVSAAVQSVGDVFAGAVASVQSGPAAASVSPAVSISQSIIGLPETRISVHQHQAGKTLVRTDQTESGKCVGFMEWFDSSGRVSDAKNGVLYCPRG